MAEGQSPPAGRKFRLRWGSVSITGNYRENNEDRCHVDPKGRYFIVADGMGGQSAGERASGLVAEIVPQRLDQNLNFSDDVPERIVAGIDDAVGKANNEIMALAQVTPDCHNMGTTVALLVVSGDLMYVAGVGDSRVYCQRGQHLEQMTTDHSLSEALRQAGTISKEEAAVHRYKHVLVRYLGSKEGGTGTNPVKHEPQPGDRFLICSDGVTDGVGDDDLNSLLRSANDPEQVAKNVIEAAQAGGSKDNITCVVIFVEAS